MPELPEVETIKRDLEKEVLGKRIKLVDVSLDRAVRRHPNVASFKSKLEGHKISFVKRRGKYLLIGLDNDDMLIVHLGMSGQLLIVKRTRDARDAHTHVVVRFTQGGELRFVDPRTFGEMFVSSLSQLEQIAPELNELGFDPLEGQMSWINFDQLLRQKRTKLKSLLTDQKFVAGIGNIYSDEILFAAGLRYDRISDTLTTQEVRRLYRAMVETLSEAIRHRGSSLADEQYKDLFGEVGDYQSQHQVYGRESQPCRRCHNKIVRLKVNGRPLFMCEHCQI
ncbi:MAG: bifunctional DNA-formamidopyrimidine glycosylase/DNA-(apurinic or apyrimidinic site) lyase [Actinobacteria bacterium]|jgi:formamidopyrimidine-DNA glycosylase|nr:bifunctional DNA-formamidopyrimidine glycosylase/DNA-(apurinic or apyrimidinic site) lyase [Actinomycetota bacterium]MCL6104234.1 bifunctional DNA-formamidopyrimidine glycosylase/DNA-(apurinic or apyrimidinic site) lyase [Actinomycetota bacterium]